ncbi:hypothetical protein TBLA_0E00380 [Henningerozyma blattae CBS 6284]|uniref:Dolichyl-diphosphooligosaccharide-protein glycosyltransferase subunit OST5 n=1 Tax=Henningerozyma blattae (strain ATCC 34711 / CBS 6284 / DSM 70876 / NBRC 10599 / NRRL Y-10934 / UCD 77-7) TaxID=1071380 RepID=I2H3Z7_HENB6|nr:hypothetical protein TBLA_0E00380 [Tetrapisispora blattae CBS 6284]CCH61099.1 hypothetical protein TBLA_0E00380 [Tetrapisispora blattae CBS 6284]
MGYEQLFREYSQSTPISPSYKLESQPTYAIIACILAVLFISLGLTISSSKSNFAVKLILYTTVSALGSLFCGLSAVFASNSFGVYV